MAITKLIAAQRARQLLTERDEALGFSVPMLIALADEALSDLGIIVASQVSQRHSLRTNPASTTISVVAGVADLSTLVNTTQVLIDFFPTADIKGANGRSYQWLNSLDQLRSKRKTDSLFTFCALDGLFLRIRDQGAIDSLTETASVSASIEPMIDQVTVPLEAQFVDLIVARAKTTLVAGGA